MKWGKLKKILKKKKKMFFILVFFKVIVEEEILEFKGWDFVYVFISIF